MNPEVGNPIRAQGVMVTDPEIERIIDYWQKNADMQAEKDAPWEKLLQEPDDDEDEGLIEKAISRCPQQRTGLRIHAAAAFANWVSSRREAVGSA